MKNENSNGENVPSTGDMAVIGEGTPNRTAISIQVLQNIYHELTGKSEEVSKTYDAPLQLELNHFLQLNLRIQQICEQYNIQAANCSIAVFYVNDTKDVFSSFERFQAFNAGSSSSVESVLITYNFLIVLPKLAQPQSYTVAVRVASPVAIQRKMNSSMPFNMPKIFRMMGGARMAVVNIKYVDYAVARTLLNTVDEWVNAAPKAMTNPVWKSLRNHTDYLPLITRYTAGLVVSILIYFSVPSFISTSSTAVEFLRFSLAAGVGLFTAYKLAEHLGSAAEDSIDRWSDLSYICLTDGDKKEVTDAKGRNGKSLLWGALSLLGGFAVSVAAKVIVQLLVGV
ncbi:hypothetical protein [Variovorax sp. N23]|uniref:hypothetical protein n=1 Tax=Variovorax sp. N23 TaxID=2980555 RepID=UPI0021C9712D|nr:hypothetical protein [Variovorax sp. N23]MCU4120941.1 hypothetical protein [Variovorax sp. N23]